MSNFEISRRRLIKLLGTSTALLIPTGLSTYANGEINVSEPSFGLAKDHKWSTSEHRELMTEYGASDFATVYYNVTNPDNLKNPYAWVKESYLDNGIDVVLALIIGSSPNPITGRSVSLSEADPDTVGNHQRILDGELDEPLRALAKAITKDGRLIVIRPFYEGDGNWFSWGIYAGGNTAESFARAFVHVVNIFLEENAPILVELNLNRRDAKGQVLGDLETYFPTVDPYVSMYSLSSYNRCGTSSNYPELKTFKEEFGPAYDVLAEVTDKPINVAETSTSDLCGPQMPWFREMISDIQNDFPQTKMVTYYFGTIPVGVASNAVEIVWGLPTPEERREFKRLLDQARSGDLIPIPRPRP